MIARALSADWVERNIPANIKHLKQGVDNEGWRFVLMMRLIPWMPYALKNYALGLSRYIVALFNNQSVPRPEGLVELVTNQWGYLNLPPLAALNT